MSKEMILDFKIQRMAFNTEFFGNFIQQLIDKLRSLNLENADLVLDNISFHKSASIKTLVEFNGYSIFFTTLFTIFKSYLKFIFTMEKSYKKTKRC